MVAANRGNGGGLGGGDDSEDGPVIVRIEADYLPESKQFKLSLGHESGPCVSVEMQPGAFARAIEYLELVWASYNAAKAKGEI